MRSAPFSAWSALSHKADRPGDLMSNPFDYLKQDMERRARQRTEAEESLRKARTDLEAVVASAAAQWDAVVRRLLADLQAAAYTRTDRIYRVEHQAARAEADSHMLKRGNIFRRHALWRLDLRVREDPEEWRTLLQVRLRVAPNGKAEGFVCERFDWRGEGPADAALNEKSLEKALRKIYPPGSVA